MKSKLSTNTAIQSESFKHAGTVSWRLVQMWLNPLTSTEEKWEKKPGLIHEACHTVCCQLALLHSAHPKHVALMPSTSLRLSLPGRLWLSAACPCAWTLWFRWECVKLTKSNDTRTVSHWTQRPKARALIAGSYQLNSTECCWGSGWQGQAQTWTQLTSLSWGYLQVELMVTNHMTGIPKSETRVKNQP